MLVSAPVLARCPTCSQLFPVVGNCKTTCPFCEAAVVVSIQRVIGSNIPSPPGGRTTIRPAAREHRGSGRAFIETLDASDVQKLAIREADAMFAEVRARVRTSRRPAAVPLTPWETPGVGRVTGFGRTLQHVLVDPASFFATLAQGKIGGAVSFAALILIPVAVVQVLSVWAIAQGTGAFGLAADRVAAVAGLAVLGSVVGAAYLVLAYHVLCALLAGRRIDVRDTARAAGFGFAPLVLGLVPVVGVGVGLAWCIIIHSIALQKIHRLSGVKASFVVLAALLPIAAQAVFRSF